MMWSGPKKASELRLLSEPQLLLELEYCSDEPLVLLWPLM